MKNPTKPQLTLLRKLAEPGATLRYSEIPGFRATCKIVWPGFRTEAVALTTFLRCQVRGWVTWGPATPSGLVFVISIDGRAVLKKEHDHAKAE